MTPTSNTSALPEGSGSGIGVLEYAHGHSAFAHHYLFVTAGLPSTLPKMPANKEYVL